MTYILQLFVSLFCAVVIHEAAHWLTAYVLGYSIIFRLEYGYLWKIPIPRGLWYMPYEATESERKTIAAAGFTTELAAIIPALFLGFWLYAAVALLHFTLYPYYAGDASDFRWFKN